MKTIKVSEGEYRAIHGWLIRTYGKANTCTNPYCTKRSKVFHWALRKNSNYKKDKRAFIELCSICHEFYDKKNDKRGKKHNTNDLTAHVRLPLETHAKLKLMAAEKDTTIGKLISSFV